jgi:hypothetical protein
MKVGRVYSLLLLSRDLLTSSHNVDPDLPSANFHGNMLHHCLKTYSARTRWLFHIDVDEFVIFSNMLEYEHHPYQLPGLAQWQYPLHDLLLSKRFRLARCVPLSREGVFRNVGVVSLPPQSSVLEALVYRETRRGGKGAGKVGVRA